jgi:hypothetical protein
MIIAGRCGQDSDCNPSSAASILGNMYGASNIPDIWKKGLNYDTRKFSATEYTLNDVVDLNVELMEQVLASEGAAYKDGVWTIAKDTEYTPVAWEQWTDAFDAGLVAVDKGNGIVSFKLVTNGSDPVKSIKFEIDGKVYDCMVAQYAFSEEGDYTVKYTVTSESGVKVEKTRVVQVRALTEIKGTPICSVTAPTGGGNKDMSVMFDGYVPYVSDSDSLLQYDTYDGGAMKDSVYVGLTFKETAKISGIDFTEGKHFNNGGWFATKPTVEVYVGGVWKAVDAKISRVYPEGNTLAAHGNNFDIYTFTFDAVECDGVRLIGKPGGTAYFISVGELTPHAERMSTEKIKFDNANAPMIVCGTTNPTGGGNKNIGIIADGVKGSGGTQQYDTYAGQCPDKFEYFGYIYKEKVTVTGIEYTEGAHSDDGGWFKNGSLKVEALINGVWVEVASNVASVYPNGNSKSAFGKAYETFNITLNTAVECDGIRIAGIAGGTSGWVGVSELTVKTAK